MTTIRTLLVIGLACASLAACGRKNLPVAPTPEGQAARPAAIQPDAAGLARAPGITPGVTDRSVTPREVSRNVNAENRPFILDGLLN